MRTPPGPGRPIRRPVGLEQDMCPPGVLRSSRATSCRRSGSPPGPDGRCHACRPVGSGWRAGRGPHLLPSMATRSPCRNSRSRYSALLGASRARPSSATWIPRPRPRVLQVPPLVGRCAAGWHPSNTGSRLLVLHLHGDAVPRHRPSASRESRSHSAPRGDDLHVGHQGVGAELEAHLVVAFAGGACEMASALVLRAISTRRLAMSGRAMEVPSRYSPS